MLDWRQQRRSAALRPLTSLPNQATLPAILLCLLSLNRMYIPLVDDGECGSRYGKCKNCALNLETHEIDAESPPIRELRTSNFWATMPQILFPASLPICFS